MFSNSWDIKNQNQIFTEEDEHSRKSFDNFGNMIHRYQSLLSFTIEKNCLYIDCSWNQISEIHDLYKCNNLITLECHNNCLVSLDVSSLPHLKSLNCSMNKIETITGLSNCEQLVSLNCYLNQMKELDTKGLIYLQNLDVSNNKLTNLKNLQDCHLLERLYCWHNSLRSLQFQNLTSLKAINCSENELESEQLLDLHQCEQLETFYCCFNKLNILDVSTLRNLKELSCDNNHIKSIEGIYNCKNLEYLFFNDNCVESIFIGNQQNLIELECHNNKFSNTYCLYGLEECHKLQKLNVSSNTFSQLNLDFLKFLTHLYLTDNHLTTSLRTIHNWTNIQILDCSENMFMNELNVTSLIHLRNLNCSLNKFTELIGLDHCSKLIHLNCSFNELKKIDLKNKKYLEFFNCQRNDIQEIHFGECEFLRKIDCRHNHMIELKIEHLTDLSNLFITGNKISIVETTKKIPNFKSDPFTEMIVMDEKKQKMKKYVEELRSINMESNDIPLCSICRNILMYPVKNVVGSYIQTYCKSCFIRWFVIEKKHKDPNTGVFIFTIMKEDIMFNKLYESYVFEKHEKYC